MQARWEPRVGADEHHVYEELVGWVAVECHGPRIIEFELGHLEWFEVDAPVYCYVGSTRWGPRNGTVEEARKFIEQQAAAALGVELAIAP